MRREGTYLVKSKNITLGSTSPITVQTMLKSHFYKYNTCYISELMYRGCDILRFSINSDYSKKDLQEFIKSSPLPLVIDIKSDKSQAKVALDGGIDAVRINPALLSKQDITEVFRIANANNAIVRIGTNEGSTHGKSAITLVIDTINLAESLGFKNIVTSIKASNSDETLSLNRELASLTSYPIHLGLTEAGGVVTSAVRSTVVLSKLLENGIGSTIRYSMAGGETKEVEAATELLSSLNLRRPYLHLVVCPSCARCTFLTERFLEGIESELYKITYYNKCYISVAIMGCPLNGIGEARNADFGISGNNITAVIFKKGEIVEKCDAKNAKEAFLSVIKSSLAS